jgi:protein gp37
MADIFDVDAPEGQLDRLWELIRKTDNLIWQLLTKRPEGYWDVPGDIMCCHDVWKGVTCEDQEWYDKRWPMVMNWPGVRWISYEPALGPIRMGWRKLPDWLVCGGESGNKFRPMQQIWATDIQAKCADLGVKFFMKQMAARTPKEGKFLIPDFLNIQEFPA